MAAAGLSYPVLPSDQLALIYAIGFWAGGQAIGWTIAWIMGKQGWADHEGMRDFLMPRAGALLFWLYVLVWIYGALDL